MCVAKFKRPAADFWAMTVADLFTSLADPEKKQTATTAMEQAAMVAGLVQRFELLGKLTPAQRVELEKLKADLM